MWRQILISLGDLYWLVIPAIERNIFKNPGALMYLNLGNPNLRCLQVTCENSGCR